MLPYLTAANTVRDVDRIRAALGEPKLSYLGYAYGTCLGACYAAMFPHRTDRTVLDSAVDPDLVWYAMRRTWSPATAIRMPDFTGWAATHDATYRLGATPAAVRRTYDELAAPSPPLSIRPLRTFRRTTGRRWCTRSAATMSPGHVTSVPSSRTSRPTGHAFR